MVGSAILVYTMLQRRATGLSIHGGRNHLDNPGLSREGCLQHQTAEEFYCFRKAEVVLVLAFSTNLVALFVGGHLQESRLAALREAEQVGDGVGYDAEHLVGEGVGYVLVKRRLRTGGGGGRYQFADE
jgi:hypothetical protein